MSGSPPLWDGVLRRLGAVLPEFALEAWIRPLGVSEESGRLRLLAPTPFHAERVRARYLEPLRRCAAEEAGRSVPVEVEAAEPGAASAATSGPASEARQGAAGPAPSAAPSPAERARAAASERERSEAGAESAQAQLPHTFETFVVGSTNALAREASLALAHGRPGGVSPLYLSGPSGSGKSHLAHALLAEVRRSGVRGAVHRSAESFTSELVAAIRSRQTDRFKQRYREACRLLVLEDVQFLEGKRATQLELFHTLEHLRAAGGRVVLTGDRLPRELPRLDGRLSSAMSSGLVAEMEPPDASLRRDILRAKASRGGVRIPDDCLELLVERVQGSARDLEGVLIQLVASASLLQRAIDFDLTERAIRKVTGGEGAEPRAIDADTVLECVCSFFGLRRADLASRSRRRSVLVPRQLAMYLCRRYTERTMGEIGRALGRDHPSVRNAVERVERAILERAPLRYQVEALAERLERRRRGLPEGGSAGDAAGARPAEGPRAAPPPASSLPASAHHPRRARPREGGTGTAGAGEDGASAGTARRRSAR